MLEVVNSSVGPRFPPHSTVLQTSGDTSEEELTVLPRHTKVVVTGNNRTKSVLVGLEGVVKKAVGLGGWHWLVLTNGIEVKLQRNALTVIEAPIGNEDDEELEFETAHWNGSDMTSDDTQRYQKPRHRIHRSFVMSRKTPYLPSSPDSQSTSSPKVDISKLDMGALWKYLRHFNLVDAGIHSPSREQAIDIVQRHFMSQQLDELQVISVFIQSVKKLKTTLCRN